MRIAVLLASIAVLLVRILSLLISIVLPLVTFLSITSGIRTVALSLPVSIVIWVYFSLQLLFAGYSCAMLP